MTKNLFKLLVLNINLILNKLSFRLRFKIFPYSVFKYAYDLFIFSDRLTHKKHISTIYNINFYNLKLPLYSV